MPVEYRVTVPDVWRADGERLAAETGATPSKLMLRLYVTAIVEARVKWARDAVYIAEGNVRDGMNAERAARIEASLAAASQASNVLAGSTTLPELSRPVTTEPDEWVYRGITYATLDEFSAAIDADTDAADDPSIVEDEDNG